MEDYNQCIRDDSDSGLVPPEIPATKNFEIKAHILNLLKDITFVGKEHEDAYKQIDEVLEIANYFNISNVTKDMVMLGLLPVVLNDSTKDWLKSLALGDITTWENLRK